MGLDEKIKKEQRIWEAEEKKKNQKVKKQKSWEAEELRTRGVEKQRWWEAGLLLSSGAGELISRGSRGAWSAECNIVWNKWSLTVWPVQSRVIH